MPKKTSKAKGKPDFEDARLAVRLYDLRREAELRRARAMLGTHVIGKPFGEVAALFDYAHPENAHLRQVEGYWEMAASFVLRGIFHPDVYLDTCSEGLFTYAAFSPHLERIWEHKPAFLSKTREIVRRHKPLARRVEEVLGRLPKAPEGAA
jgi:hypothetical protein